MGDLDDLLARHRAVMPSWLALYYDRPIEIERGEGRQCAGLRGQPLPRLLRRDPHHDDRLHATRGHPGGERAGGQGPAHLDALPHRPRSSCWPDGIAALSGIPDAKVFFTTSGTEATDAALLLATAYRRSNQVLALRNSYHGRSFTAVGITGNRSWSATSLSPVHTFYVHGGHCCGGPFAGLGDDEVTAACVADLEDVITTQTAGDVACFPSPSRSRAWRVHLAARQDARGVQGRADRHGILWISDEVRRDGAHRRPLLGLAGARRRRPVARPDDLRQGTGQRAVDRRGGGPRRCMDCLPANSISTFGAAP